MCKVRKLQHRAHCKVDYVSVFVSIRWNSNINQQKTHVKLYVRNTGRTGKLITSYFLWIFVEECLFEYPWYQVCDGIVLFPLAWKVLSVCLPSWPGNACSQMHVFVQPLRKSKDKDISVWNCAQSIRTLRLFSKSGFVWNYRILENLIFLKKILNNFPVILAWACMFQNSSVFVQRLRTSRDKDALVSKCTQHIRLLLKVIFVRDDRMHENKLSWPGNQLSRKIFFLWFTQTFICYAFLFLAYALRGHPRVLDQDNVISS